MTVQNRCYFYQIGQLHKPAYLFLCQIQILTVVFFALDSSQAAGGGPAADIITIPAVTPVCFQL